MLSISKIKYLCSLERKKYRIKEQKIVLDGKRLIDEAIDHKVTIDHIWINDTLEKNAKNDDLINKIKKHKIKFSYEEEKSIRKASNTKNSQGIIALVSINNLYNNNLNKFGNQIIVLDQISDPGNLGTIIRTCAWFGIHSIILTENSADIFNSKCIRSSVGGHFFIKNFMYLSYDSINNFLSENNFLTFCADLGGEKNNFKNMKNKWALILGSEAHGLSGKLNYDKKVTIHKKGRMESLNISIAAGIILNEFTR